MTSTDHTQRALLSLLRWLGPWTPDSAAPRGIRKDRRVLRAGRIPGVRGHLLGSPAARPAGWRYPEATTSQLELVTYYPRGDIAGHYVVAQGLHYEGPDDPRLDRFCRVLAAAGFVVHAPMLPAYLDLLLSPSASDDLELCVRSVCSSLPRGTKPSLFSISFGSCPALEVASRVPEAIDAVMTFGGYADLDAALRFCLDGEMATPSGKVRLKRDPLNAPVLFLNLLPYLELGDTHALERALRELAFRTWGRPELKLPGARDSVAYALAQRVPPSQRPVFLLASGLLLDLDGETPRQWLDRGLQQAGAELDFARPDSALKRSTHPCVVLHGKEDDVIPWGESLKIYAALSDRAPCKLFITGLFAHTQAEPLGIKSVRKELSALLGMARAIAHGGQLASWIQAQVAEPKP